MKAVEAVKEKFYCFLGIVHPTVYNTVGEPDYSGSGNTVRRCLIKWKHQCQTLPDSRIVFISQNHDSEGT